MLDVIRTVTISCNKAQICCCKVCTINTTMFILYIVYFGDSSTCMFKLYSSNVGFNGI